MKRFLLLPAFLLFWLISQNFLMAQSGGRRDKNRGAGKPAHVHVHSRTRVVHTRPARRVRPRFYRNRIVVVRPRRFHTIAVLPSGYFAFNHPRGAYYFHNGLFYQPAPAGFALVAAPFGLRIGILPPGFHRIGTGPNLRFYYMGTFYKPVGEEYETTEPQVGDRVPELPEHNVDEVTLDGKTYYEYDGTLYKAVVTQNGTQYEVVGKLED